MTNNSSSPTDTLTTTDGWLVGRCSPLVSLAHTVISVALVFCIALVDAVVCEMHELVVQVLHGRWISANTMCINLGESLIRSDHTLTDQQLLNNYAAIKHSIWSPLHKQQPNVISHWICCCCSWYAFCWFCLLVVFCFFVFYCWETNTATCEICGHLLLWKY